MSLQVWLPLNGSLENQGLNDYTVINNGATVDNNGKIGQCYSFNGSNNYLKITNFNIGNEWSYGCWVYSPTSSRSWEGVIILNNNGGDTDMQLGFYTYPTGTRIQSTANGQYNSSISFTYNQWNHLFATFDGTNLKTYINGLLVNTKTITNSLLPKTNLTIGARCRGTSSYDCYFNGKINDVRIYDHCLSDKEVQEIAKGLVLHYKLDDAASIETTINLCNGSTCGTQASAASPSTWGAHKYYTVLQDTTANDPVPFQKKSVMTIDYNTDYGSGGGASVYPPAGFAIEPSTTYIYSKYIKPSDNFAYTNANFLYRYEYAAGGGSRLVEGGVFNKTNTEYLGNGWYRCWGTFTSQATAATVTLPFYTYPGKSMTYELGGIQLEKSDHITPYVISTNTPYIIDSSGYGYNGDIKGILKTSNNTARYNFSTIFDGDTAAIQTPNLTTMITDKNYTISCWTYKTQIGNKNYQTIYGGPSGFELEARSSSNTNPLFRIHNWGGGTTAYEFNKWYHFCFVHNDTESKLYINGELKITGSSANVPSGNYFIGSWSTSTSQNFDGNISDFRIYATALTAEQILELYNTSMSIDKNGNIYARELVE